MKHVEEVFAHMYPAENSLKTMISKNIEDTNIKALILALLTVKPLEFKEIKVADANSLKIQIFDAISKSNYESLVDIFASNSPQMISFVVNRCTTSEEFSTVVTKLKRGASPFIIAIIGILELHKMLPAKAIAGIISQTLRYDRYKCARDQVVMYWLLSRHQIDLFEINRQYSKKHDRSITTDLDAYFQFT